MRTRKHYVNLLESNPGTTWGISLAAQAVYAAKNGMFDPSDGAALSFKAVRKNLRSVLWSIKNKVNDGWRVQAMDINYEDKLYCDHTGEKIESAYGETE